MIGFPDIAWIRVPRTAAIPGMTTNENLILKCL
jgi:hypothetical protein